MIDKVKIGAITYTILFDETLGDSGFAGQIRYHRCQIAINEDLRPQAVMQTLWHEIVHGIMTNAGIPNDEQKEPLVDAIAFGVMQVDNPGIVERKSNDNSERVSSITGEGTNRPSDKPNRKKTSVGKS